MNVALLDDTLTLDAVRSALSGRPARVGGGGDGTGDSRDYDASDTSGGAGRRAAVMVIVHGPRKRPMVVMTVKSASLPLHAGEIAFPGGKAEEGDESLLHTALRETLEEVGLRIESEHVAGGLSPVSTLSSGFVIAPYLAVLDGTPALKPNSEVAEILRIPLGALLDSVAPDDDPGHGSMSGMYTFEHAVTGGRKVWGASARILKQVRDALAAPGPRA